METTKKLKEIKLKSATSEEVIKILSSRPIISIKSIVRKGVYILRTRKGGGFTKRSEMTYCPIEKCKTLQRATLAGNTMFYGVISDKQEHLENARAISISECSNLCRDGIDSIGREKFSISYWEVVKPLNVISFISDTIYPDVHDNALLTDLRNVFKSEIESASEEDKDLFRFISAEFSKVVKDQSEYLISATIATMILKNIPDIDGILYPSVQLGGQAGLNIALSPKATNKKLRFIRIIDNTLYKNKDKSFIRMEKITNRNDKTKEIYQIPNEYIEKELEIISLSTLPTI